MDRFPSSSPEPAGFVAARRVLVVGAAVVVAGLALAGTVDRGAGGVVVVVGWALALWGLHRVGRAGAS